MSFRKGNEIPTASDWYSFLFNGGKNVNILLPSHDQRCKVYNWGGKGKGNDYLGRTFVCMSTFSDEDTL